MVSGLFDSMVNPNEPDTFVDNIDTNQSIDNIDLENQVLQTHIDDVRNLLKKYNLSPNDDPHEVINNNQVIKQTLSEVILDINHQSNDLRIISDNLFSFTNNVKSLSNGVKPYCYNNCNSSTDIFKKISNDFSEYNLQIEHVIFKIEEIEKNIGKIRRLYDNIIHNIYNYT